jgi:adenylate kinase
MIIVLTGAPGAGKGTQADLLRDRLGYRKLSTGDALRKHVKAETEIGVKAKEIMNAGHLVPDDVLFEILRQELGDNAGEKILLDGYPRNVQQAQDLNKLATVHSLAAAIQLDVDRIKLLGRLTGRRVCSQCGKSYHLEGMMPQNDGVCDDCGAKITQRDDDHEAQVEVRLDVYERQTKPVLEYYKGIGKLKVIDGSDTTEQVFAEIAKSLDQL